MSAAVAMRLIAETLAAASGVDPHTDTRLPWIVETRCRALRLPDAAAYAEYLLATPDETANLIDAVTVPETRFFRDAAVFDHLLRWLPGMAAEFPGELRALSAPCSTGQEPYSLAACFQEAGVPLSRVSIRAVDLSTTALDTARRGVYPLEALRQLSAERRNAFGHKDGSHWKINPDLQARVHFQRLNLAAPGALDGERYHLILCRNLFIYLRPDARRTLAESLANALLPGGRLILGTADFGEELAACFAPVKPAASFAFTPREAATAEVPAVSSRAAAALLQHKPRRHPGPALKHAPTPEAPRQPDAAALYRGALHHHSQGDLQKAEYRCRQALYLEPGYLPAMELLEALWRDLPDARLRRALSARIGRSRAAAEGKPVGEPA